MELSENQPNLVLRQRPFLVWKRWFLKHSPRGRLRYVKEQFASLLHFALVAPETMPPLSIVVAIAIPPLRTASTPLE
jgi:hypothetical protein